MVAVLELRRGATAAVAALTPAAGEFVVNTDDNTVRVGDGTTVGGWTIGGHTVVSVTGTSYAVASTDQGHVLVTTNGGATAISLPQAVVANNFGNGQGLWVLVEGAGTVTITPTTSTINGAATLVLTTGQSAAIVSDGANYFALVCATPGASATLAGLSDVNIASLADDDILVYQTSDSKWHNERAKYVVGASSPNAVLTASQNIVLHRFPKAVTFPANFGAYLGLASQAGGTANATGSTVVNVDQAASATPNTFSTIGTITIGAGGVAPTFATSGGTAKNFAQGDVLRIQGPVSPDATFAGFYATLVGFET